MLNEPVILTDIEMTACVIRHSKGGNKEHDKIRDEWLEYTEQAFFAKNGDKIRFIETVNNWLRHHKTPIKVTDFQLMDEEIGGTDWTIELIE